MALTTCVCVCEFSVGCGFTLWMDIILYFFYIVIYLLLELFSLPVWLRWLSLSL